MFQLNCSPLNEHYQYVFVKTLEKKYPKVVFLIDNLNLEMLHINHLTVTVLNMDRHWNILDVPAFFNLSANKWHKYVDNNDEPP